MAISKDEVRSVAELARLQLEEKKLDQFAKQMDSILEYVHKLEEVDTSAVEPMYTPVDNTTVLRKDRETKEHSREEILENAPGADGQFFTVPKII
ncbi:MAG: Asp-tRNA(Asn)/Glu-tRNA(Gln) amidotransferase subunit GatC [Desulfonatronovibrionaceae bacterium]